MMDQHASGQILTAHRVLSFDGNVLKGPERPEDVSENPPVLDIIDTIQGNDSNSHIADES